MVTIAEKAGYCQDCTRTSTCIHDDGEWCGEHCPYEQAVRAERGIAAHFSFRGDCAYCTDPFYGHPYPHRD